jgi:hypothetical protein
MAGDYEEMRALCERARRLCAETSAVRQQLARTRQETHALLEDVRTIDTQLAWSGRDTSLATSTCDEQYLPWAEPNEAALDTLRIVRALLSEYPIEWQVKLVRVLAARTATVAYDQLHAQRVLSA